jgi:hypothetical protein
MMKKGTIFTMLFLSAFIVTAQNFQKITISYEKIGDGLYDMYAENPNHFPLQISLQFTEFVNYGSSCSLPYIGTVMPGKNKLMNLRRTLLDIPGSFKHTFTTRVGAYPVNYDPNTIYHLPVAKGKQTKALRFDVSKTDDPSKIMWSFALMAGDTVFPCREGVVCMITESQITNGYRSGENAITILHPDNSFGKYEVFADSSLMVKLGDTITTGSPLGLAGGCNYALGCHVRFSVYYCNARIDSINDQKIRNYYKYVNPLFETEKSGVAMLKENGIYTAK